MNRFNVTTAQYKADELGNNAYIIATIDGVEMSVPLDLENVHYAFIKAKHDDADDSFTITDAS